MKDESGMNKDIEQALICPCCKVSGYKFKDFSQQGLCIGQGASEMVLICKRCGVFFREINGWNNYKATNER